MGASENFYDNPLPRNNWINGVFDNRDVDMLVAVDFRAYMDQQMIDIPPEDPLAKSLEDPMIKIKNYFLSRLAELAAKDSLTGDFLDLMEKGVQSMDYGTPQEFRERQFIGLWEVIEMVTQDPLLLTAFSQSNISGTN